MKKCSYPGCEIMIESSKEEPLVACATHTSYLTIVGLQLGICPRCGEVASIIKWGHELEKREEQSVLFLEYHSQCKEKESERQQWN